MSRSHLLLAAAALASTVAAGCGSATKPHSAATAAPKARLTSSIRDGAQLGAAVPWQARLANVDPSNVAEVRFLIDGRAMHVERKAPYEFAGDGNRLLPGTLKRGSHTLAVDAKLTDGRRLTTASTATVAGDAHSIPRQVLGRWKRTVTPSDVRRTDAFRRPEYGEPLPRGTWTLLISADAVARYIDPYKQQDSLTVGQVRFEHGGRLIVGNEIPNAFPGAEGYFCPETVGTGRYRWSIENGALVVHAVDDRQCADRNSFWNGRFTR
jgi:hypothetical protein